MRIVIIGLVLIFIAAYLLGGFTYSQTNYAYQQPADQCVFDSTQFIFEPYTMNASTNPNMTEAAVTVPAVDQDGNGVATNLLVQVVPGTGKALVNIDKLLFWVDTQNSIRTARAVAEMFVEKDLSETDIVYTITADASVVEGPSAGAALTIATIAALRGVQTDPTVMVTGTINPDGTIGQIGGALEKARAAKSIGAKLFLVPRGQSIETKFEQRRSCKQIGAAEYCTIDTVPIHTNIESIANITVKEVHNINEALNYFIGG